MVKLFVEGGGDSKSKGCQALPEECQKGFRRFLEKADLKGNMPRIIACGARRNAYEKFCKELEFGGTAILLVDSEGPVKQDATTADPWESVRKREAVNQQNGQTEYPDGDWATPPGAKADQLHLMVQCMETWFLADRDAMKKIFGKEYNEKALPSAHKKIEEVSKEESLKSLKNAGAYEKGRHSFKILAELDPQKVMAASPWAKRFVEAMKTTMGVGP